METTKESINLAHKPIVDGCSKHIHVKYHYIHQEVNNSGIKLSWIPTACQAADGLTKPLLERAHRHFCDLIGLTDCTDLIERADNGASEPLGTGSSVKGVT